MTLSWGSSTDNIGVAGYRIYRDGALVGTAANTTYTTTVGGRRTPVTYYVRAFDAAGNESGASNSVSLTP